MSLQEHLQAIYDERGELTPALVVDVARSDEHPLHERFDWNDTTAAEAHRRDQARQLIRSVRVIFVNPKTERKISVRAFHAVKDPISRRYAYEPAAVVMQDPVVMQLLRAEMERDWRALRRRFEEFDAFWEMVIDDTRVVEGLGF